MERFFNKKDSPVLLLLLFITTACQESIEEKYYYPPPGNHISHHDQRTPEEAGLNLKIINKINNLIKENFYLRKQRIIYSEIFMNTTNPNKYTNYEK